MFLRCACFIWLVAIAIGALGYQKSYAPENMDSAYYQELLYEYGNNKTLLPGYEAQVLIALSHYPELKNTRIRFRFIKSGIPLTARPTVWSTIFRSAKKRTYLITIAKKTDPRWSAILLHKLPYNAQIGVLGHEIGHVVDFSDRSFWGMLRVLVGNLSKRFMDNLEYHTDLITIRHGLGYQLLAWSTYVREVLQFEEHQIDPESKETKENERYMSPATIRQYIQEEEMYVIE